MPETQELTNVLFFMNHCAEVTHSRYINIQIHYPMQSIK